MKVEELVQLLQRNKVSLAVNGDKLKIQSKGSAIQQDLLNAIKEQKEALIAYLKSDQQASSQGRKIVATGKESGELSLAQQRLWLIDQMQGSSPQYNIPTTLKLKGNLNQTAIQSSLNTIVERHHVLRTLFENSEGQGLQVVTPPSPLNVQFLDLSGMDQIAQQHKLQACLANEAVYCFDLSSEWPIRAMLINLCKQECVLSLTIHHIATDGWSMGVLVKEFAQLYQSYCLNLPASMPSLPAQYIDYAQWQRVLLDDGEFDSQLEYWQEKLHGIPALHSLPLDYARPATQSYRGQKYVHQLDNSLLDNLSRLGQNHKASLFMVLQCAFSLLLGRWSREKDIVIGSPVAGRNAMELEPLIGFFVNTLVLRTDLSQNISFKELLQQARQTALDAYTNDAVSFDVLVDKLNPNRSDSYNPLFQIMFSLTHEQEQTMALSDLQVEVIEHADQVAKFDLTLNIIQNSQGLELNWLYAEDLFDAATIERLALSFEVLLQAIIADSACKINQLNMVTGSDELSLKSLAQTNNSFLPTETLSSLFEQQAERSPDAIALICEQSQVTYAALNEQANQLAAFLVMQGVKPDSFVSICLERSVDMVVAILAVLKSGGAYVPLDPKSPQARFEHILQDSGSQILLTSTGLSNKFGDCTSQVICLDEQAVVEALCQLPANNPLIPELTGQHLAYVIYTSGSTGKPKGVMVSHDNVVRLIKASDEVYDFNGTDTWSLFHSYAFDFSVWEIWGAFLHGARLVVVPYWASRDSQAFLSLIKEHNVTVLSQTPSAFQQLLNEDIAATDRSLQSLRYVVFGGEALTSDLTSLWYENYHNDTQLMNGYGITETSVLNIFFPVTRENHLAVSNVIGNPLSDVAVYILDDDQRQVPIGAIGELCIAGDSVAEGYLNRAELTEQRFIANPFGEDGQPMMYRSGDLVRCLPGGELAYIGRLDEQVKLRGFRIELGEINECLAQCKAVEQAAVVVQESGDVKNLVAYVVKAATDSSEDRELTMNIKAELSQTLPEYMVPSAFVYLDKLPLNINGKLDRAALPMPQQEEQQIDYVAATNDIEQALVDIWSQLLGMAPESISTTTSFFDLGGNSLLAVRMVSEVRSRFEQEFAIESVYEASDIYSIALKLDKGSDLAVIPAISKRIPEDDVAAVSFAQQRLWFIDQLQNGSAEYNMPAALRVEGHFDLNAAEQAISLIIARHESLRTVFSTNGSESLQHIRSEFRFQLSEYDLSYLDGVSQQQKVEQWVEQERVRVFDLSQDLMVRTAYLHLSKNQQSNTGILLFTMHHIASDGWSMDILIEEFVTQYKAIINGLPNTLEPLNIQYADYACWQRNWLSGDELERQLAYWRNQLADVPAVHSIPLDYSRPKLKQHKGAVVKTNLSVELSQQLQQIATDNNLTLFMLLQGAVALTLSRHSNSSDVVLGTPVANRRHKELESLIGFFVNTLVLRTNTDLECLPEYWADVKRINQEAQAHQDIPFEQLVEHCNLSRSTQFTPLFQVMFTLNDQVKKSLDIPGVELSPVTTSGIAAKFDLDIIARTTQDKIGFSWVYDISLFSQQHVEQMAEHLVNLLSAIAQNPQAKLKDLSLSSSAEQNMLVVELNDNKTELPENQLIHEIFEEQVNNDPNQIAIFFDEEQLTYGELNRHANRLARYLQSLGVGHESLVAVGLNRGPELIVAMLAILKAGGSYVPVDPANPQNRLDYILQDCNCELLLAHSHMQQLTALSTVKQIPLSMADINCLAERFSEETLPRLTALSSESLANVIYTSGSTGKPKGVMVEHGNVMQLVCNEPAIEINHSDVLVYCANPVFDASTWEIWGALLNGATSLIVPNEVLLDEQRFASMLTDKNVTILQLTAGLFDQYASRLADTFSNLKYLLFGGDKADFNAVSHLLQTTPPKHLLHTYGPTETVAFTMTHEVDNAVLKNKRLPIGLPIANTQCYILDSELRPLALGETGDLYIGGQGVCRGYLNNSQLTQERFINCSLDGAQPQRLYKTGDLARRLPDGSVEFIGRIDDQVKIRGFRIELGEIESHISACDGVEASLVKVQTDPNGLKQLVGYVVPHKAMSPNNEEFAEDLHGILQHLLPDYLVPAAFVLLDSFPLTPNGKVDKKALPEATSFGVSQQLAYVAPENEIEEKLQNIWSKLLNRDVALISTRVSFFELGGHSLLLIGLVAEIKKNFNVEISIRDIFALQQIKLLAEFVAYEQLRHSIKVDSGYALTEKEIEVSI